MVAGGGVAANSALRARLSDLGRRGRRSVVLPSIALCTDNAAMVAAVAAYRLAADGPTPARGAGRAQPPACLIRLARGRALVRLALEPGEC